MEKEVLSDKIPASIYIESLTDEELVSSFKTVSSRRDLIEDMFLEFGPGLRGFGNSFWKKDFSRFLREDEMFIGFCRTTDIFFLLDYSKYSSHFSEIEFLLRFIFDFKLYEVKFMNAFYNSRSEIMKLEDQARGVEKDFTKTDSFYAMLKAYQSLIGNSSPHVNFRIMFIFLSIWEDSVSSEIKDLVASVMTKDVSFLNSGTLYELTTMAVEGANLKGAPNPSFVDLVNDQPASWILSTYGFDVLSS